MLAGGPHDVHHVGAHQIVDVDGGEGFLGGQQFLQGGHLLEGVDGVGFLLQDHDFHLLPLDRVAQLNAQHEPVHLGLRQGKRPLVLNRILRGQDGEGPRQVVGAGVDGDLPLLHGLEQGGLGLGRGPVDLVGEHNLGHDGTGPELELQVLLVEDADAGHVAGQHVGRELDAAEGAADAAGDGAGQHGLAHAGHVLNQHVAFAQQCQDREADLFVLANDDLAHVGQDAFRKCLYLLHKTCLDRGDGGTSA